MIKHTTLALFDDLIADLTNLNYEVSQYEGASDCLERARNLVEIAKECYETAAAADGKLLGSA